MDKKKVHLIGIGGISMSGIAEMLLNANYIVSGTDLNETDITEKLKVNGAIIKKGHHPEMIKDADIVVYTAAIKEDDPERLEAQKLNKETYERAEFLGQLSQAYQNCICISGTHGKSTTTGMVSLVFLTANLNPTIQIGANLSQINGNYYIGGKEYLIMEACEYVDSFLHFHPTSEIILNIDDDHLDYFKNIDNIKKSFTKYLNLLPTNGFAVVNADDANVTDIIPQTNTKIITYGLNNKALFTAQNITQNDLGFYSFDVYYQEEFFFHLDLTINGKHNIYNALPATSLCHEYHIAKETIKKGLEAYHGVDRRFQYLGEYQGAKIYDDYAHHPTEIASTWEAVKTVKHHESWAVFQSHTYSRTLQHLDEFADILANFDHVIIAKIYPAREINTFGVREDELVAKIKLKNSHVIYLDDFAKITDYLKENIKPDDLVITIGAGPINTVGYNLVQKNAQ